MQMSMASFDLFLNIEDVTPGSYFVQYIPRGGLKIAYTVGNLVVASHVMWPGKFFLTFFHELLIRAYIHTHTRKHTHARNVADMGGGDWEILKFSKDFHTF